MTTLAPTPWTPLQRFGFWLSMFFATCGVGLWAATLWDGGFALGLGWAAVLYLAIRLDVAHGG